MGVSIERSGINFSSAEMSVTCHEDRDFRQRKLHSSQGHLVRGL